MRHIQAYFQTESEAESARSTLETYRTEQLEVSRLPTELDRQSPLLVPFALAGDVQGTTGVGTPIAGAPAGAYIGANTLDAEDHNHNNDDLDGRNLTYSLSAKVEESDYDEVVRILRENNGHVAHFDD